MNWQRIKRHALNGGILIIVGYSICIGLAWAADWREASITQSQKALRMAKDSRSLETWLRKEHGYQWSAYDNNESIVRVSIGSIRQHIITKIVGWKSKKVSDETYLVSCTYYDQQGHERGYYFEVNLNVGSVTDIFSDTPMEKQFEEYGIHPDWKIVETPDSEYPNLRRLDLCVAD
jgi:hypothetical protein